MKIHNISFLFSLSLFFVLTSCTSPKSPDENNSNNSNNITVGCGNGIKESGEQCDDGNLLNHDGCSDQCTIEVFCGNGVTEPGEECDDGNFEDGDGCDKNCNTEVGCGNGILDIGEECDDDNIVSGDGCSEQCLISGDGPACGNGILEYTEGCDDGNTVSGDGCDQNCKLENGCGDGVKSDTEQCDDGNNISGDGCSDNCIVEFICGNGECAADQGETCETCPADCCPDCGNGKLDKDETCDDRNNTSGDGCSRGCSDEDDQVVCGNGIIEVGEECDDGNTTIHDGCSDQCEVEYVCGDLICNSEVGETCEFCPQDCCPSCGNGILQSGEQCDTNDLNGRICEDFGFDGGTLLCTSTCIFDTSSCTGTGSVCGNGIIEFGETCDGTNLNNQDCITQGYTGGTLFCDASCNLNILGCEGQVRFFFEQFDNILPPTNWVFANPWQWGIPENAGPSACFSGDFCVGTGIKGNAPSSSDYANAYFITPAIDLSEAIAPVIYFWAFQDLSSSSYDDDKWHIEYSTDGVSWSLLNENVSPAYNQGSGSELGWGYGVGSASTWQPYVIHLTSLVGNSSVYFRFSVNFDHSSYNDVAGVYIDDVMVVEGSRIPITITTSSDLGMAVANRPFSRSFSIWGGSSNFTYSFVSSHPSWLTIDSSTGQLSGTPSVSDLGNVSITIHVVDNQNSTNETQKTFTFNVMDAIFYEDFEGGALPSGWTISGSVWEYGSPAGNGPSVCASGSHCVGTDFSANYTNSMSYTSNCVTTGDIDLSSAAAANLTFKSWMYSEASYDGGILEVYDGASWVTPSLNPTYNNDYDGLYFWGYDDEVWTDFSADLSAYAGSTIRLRWCFSSDGSVNNPGWYIDDVMILGN